MVSPLTWVVVAFAALTLATMAAINAFTFFHFSQQPLTIVEAVTTNSPVQRGQDLTVRYVAEREALCRTDGDIFVLRLPDMLQVEQERRPAGLMPLGRSGGVVKVNTSNLPVGEYLVRFFMHSDCGDRLHTIEVPDIPFRIE